MVSSKRLDSLDHTYLLRYLCTLAAAEQLYNALYQWNKLGYLEVTSTSLPFFRDLASYVQVGRYDFRSQYYRLLTYMVKRYADDYVAIVKRYTPQDGSLAEQFSRDDGHPLSARDLTWSYASFLTATDRRDGKVPSPWGEPFANKFPTPCSASSATGTYAAPIPEKPCSIPTGFAVTFNILKTTIFGQNVFLYGSIPELGNFDSSKALPLGASKYTADKPLWSVRAVVPPVGNFEYNYFLTEVDGKTVTKESEPKRIFEMPQNSTGPGVCLGKVVVDDIWR